MASNFASNFVEAVPQGIALSRELKTRSKENISRKAMAILAQVEQIDPYTGVFSPDGQGVPEQGQQPPGTSAGLADLNRQYFDTIGGFQDIESYAAAKTAWGATQMGKVNEYGMAAVAAFDRGDMEGAKKLMTAATSFASPNTSSEVQIDPKTGQFIVANYDAKGSPTGGAALGRDDILDFVNMNNNPQAWANAQDVEQRHKDQMGYYYDAFNETKRSNLVQEARLQSTAEREALESRARLVNLALERDLKMLDIKGKDKEQANALIKEAQDVLSSFMSYDANAAEKNKAEFTAGNELVAFIQSNTTGEASSYDTLYSNSESGPFSGVRVTDMTIGEAIEFSNQKGPYANFVRQETGTDPDDLVGTPMGRYQIVGGTMSDAATGLGLSADTKLTPEVQDQMAVWIYQNQGPDAWVAWGDGPRAGTVKEPTQGAGILDPNDPNTLLGADGSGEEKKEEGPRMETLPWFFEPPDANGIEKKRDKVWAGMDTLMRDMHKLNPDASPTQLASMALSAFGDKKEVEVVLGDKGEPNYIKDGVSSLEISPQFAELVVAFNDANEKARALYEQRADPESFGYGDSGGGQPAIPEPPAQAAQPAPGAAAAATAPAPAPEASAIPEPAAQAAQPAPVDDTAVRTAPTVPAAPTAVPPSIAQVPELAQAVQAWIAAGRPPDGQRAIAQVYSSLPPQVQQQVIGDLRQLVPAQPYAPPADRRNTNMPQSGGLY